MTPSLPIEVWLDIFRWATLAAQARASKGTEYHVFEATGPLGTDVDFYTLQAICLVCKQWWKWNVPLFYEDIRIPRPCRILTDMLESGKDWGDGTITPPCARLVRRVCLPFSSTATPTATPPAALDVLNLCSSLETLVRVADTPYPATYDFTVDCPPLPSLRRLDWWHSNAAAASGGINSLQHVLAAAPNLQYLSVGGEIWPSYLHAPRVTLAHLTTLRLRRANAFLVLLLCRCAFPALQHVVIDGFMNTEMFWPLWEAYGAQLRTVELGLSVKFYMQDFLEHVFGGCSQLQMLNYYVLCTYVPPTNHLQKELETIGMHAQPSSLLCVGSVEYWNHLRQHFEALSQPVFPALKRVLLYGDWSAVIDDEEFGRITKPLIDRGCMIQEAS